MCNSNIANVIGCMIFKFKSDPFNNFQIRDEYKKYYFLYQVADGLQPRTGAVKDYQLVPFSIKDRTSLLFQVKACGHAHILLMANPSNQEDSVYEIVLGKSVVHFC